MPRSNPAPGFGCSENGSFRMSGSPQRPIVLLVEDSEDDVFFFRHTLRKCGVACSLFHAADGAAAIEHLKAALVSPSNAARPWPDLVFLDLKLPTFSGFEILAWLREQKLDVPLEVVVLSGSEHASDVERAMDLGASAYLVKPVAAEQLRDRILRVSATRPAKQPIESVRA
jgi:CheY-like chemotaxis protein